MQPELLSLQPGDTLFPTAWKQIEQKQITEFADATGDHQWIHIDAERCAAESPFKSTIAHGFLSVSLMPLMFEGAVSIDHAAYSVLNYGVDKIRFLEPVRCNDRIRYIFSVASRTEKALGTLFALDCKVEIEGRDKPAMLGTFLMLVVAPS